MKIGVPREIKDQEYRVGLTPASVAELVRHGHEVVVEKDAGQGVGFDDKQYLAAGARVLDEAEAVYREARLIVKVKEPQPAERAWLTPRHCLFTYLHLAPDLPQTRDLMASGATCIAYETVTDNLGRLPLLLPMSEIAGRLSVQCGAYALERSRGGQGILLSGVPGVAPAKVTILGGGTVGFNAAQLASGLGAEVTVLDLSLDALRTIERHFGGRVKTLHATAAAIEQAVAGCDLLIGAVLVPGAAAPKLVSADLVKRMKPGAAIVDVAIDQGGCIETSRPTTHSQPTYVQEGVVHYCVANMPGAVARTATLALTQATLPFVLALANKGPVQAMLDDRHLRNGLNLCAGKLTSPPVASAHGLPYQEADAVLRELASGDSFID